MVISKLAVPSIILLFACCTFAQVSMLPDCALGCARETATKAGCSVSDNACLCNNPGFASSVVGCARTTSCSPEEKTRVSDILAGMCDAASSGSASGIGTVSASVSPPGSSNPSSSDSASVTTVPSPISFSTSSSPSSSATSPAGTSSSAPSTSPSRGAAQQNRMGRAGVVGTLFAVSLGFF
ncbi:hypothetical protein DFH08DRAFT_870655 [Mycena albidolilacea]|uniref:CFEM domain-containing protein n=1 Tax=Mycena albidolilacea TaxID=1033008 RepID=A0AAD6ZYQ8_9AGAR|nr:hypothetical protein DFH08DRAFT_870655 [Mycena albidolilacea]